MLPHDDNPLVAGQRLVRDPSRAARGTVSVVVPVFNEVQNVGALIKAIHFALRSSGRAYEIVIVDDGSSDGTRELLRSIATHDPRVRGVLLRSNCGQTQAMSAGFATARGDVFITMDGDLQNDPADIPRLLDELDQGYDIVCGWRRDRKDAMATRLVPSKVANMLIRRATGVPIHDTGCSLKAYRGWVVRNLNLYSEMHRFIAALGAGLGARVAEVPVRHHARRYGVSKYGLGRIFRVVIDLIVIKMLIQFAAHPIRWFGMLALPLFAAFLILLGVGVVKINHGELSFAPSYDIVYVSGMAVTALCAANVFLLGFLAELQLKASRFFRRRISITASEAVH